MIIFPSRVAETGVVNCCPEGPKLWIFESIERVVPVVALEL